MLGGNATNSHRWRRPLLSYPGRNSNLGWKHSALEEKRTRTISRPFLDVKTLPSAGHDVHSGSREKFPHKMNTINSNPSTTDTAWTGARTPGNKLDTQLTIINLRGTLVPPLSAGLASIRRSWLLRSDHQISARGGWGSSTASYLETSHKC